MDRELMQELVEWKKNDQHIPLLLRGARQVGKTFLVREFGRQYFENCIEINFELEPDYAQCFETLNPKEILNRIELLSTKIIKPNQTLLFLDEIQACPNAIVALRYFKEVLPELHVIGAGSLLEFALTDTKISIPVGRVQYLYMKPVSFREYLTSKGHGKLIDFIKNVTLNSTIPTEVHQKCLQLIHEYTNLGGMPMVIQQFLSNENLRDCQNIQTMILRTYNDDFAKYASQAKQKYLQIVYNKTPGLVSQQIQYSKISSDTQSVNLKEAIFMLRKAGLVTPIYSTSGAGIPLNTYMNEKKYKLLFLDVGLVKRATKLDLELLFNEDIMLLNRGAIAEQLVGQELLAYQDPYDEAQLYYWTRNKKSSHAEVDYLINVRQDIIPIEVKSGKTGSLKSLQLFMRETNSPLGIRISGKTFGMRDHVLSLPFYLISELPRLIAEWLSS